MAIEGKVCERYDFALYLMTNNNLNGKQVQSGEKGTLVEVEIIVIILTRPDRVASINDLDNFLAIHVNLP